MDVWLVYFSNNRCQLCSVNPLLPFSAGEYSISVIFSTLATEKYNTVSTASSPSVKNSPTPAPLSWRLEGLEQAKDLVLFSPQLLVLFPHLSKLLERLLWQGYIRWFLWLRVTGGSLFLFLFSMSQILIWVWCSLCATNCSRCWDMAPETQGKKDFWTSGNFDSRISKCCSLLRMFWVTCLEDLLYPQIVRQVEALLLLFHLASLSSTMDNGDL